MTKTLFAMAVLGASGVAHAQSNVTIYGSVDTGFIQKSGFDTQMGQNSDNRLGFRGVEDLGGGLKATFELEKRFSLNDGTQKGETAKGRAREFQGAANVGLKSEKWGAIRLGRVNELTTETIREFDPFDQEGVAGMIDGTQRSEGIDNTIRYDSPNWNGFRFGASYSLGQNTNRDSADRTSNMMVAKHDNGDGYDNDGYGLMLGYDKGPLSLVADTSVIADSAKSFVWNVGAAYRFGDARFAFLYQQTKDKAVAQLGNGGYTLVDWDNIASMSAGKRNHYFGAGGKYGTGELNSVTEKHWLLGLDWKLGPGRLNATAQWMEVEFNGIDASDADIYKYGIGYTYDLSKRTSLYGILAYTDYEDDVLARAFGDAKDSTAALQLGITHRF